MNPDDSATLRDLLANNRTLLAYNRTALAFAELGNAAGARGRDLADDQSQETCDAGSQCRARG